MKTQGIFTIDLELMQELEKEPNKSAIVNQALTEFYQNSGLNLQRELKKIREERKKLREREKNLREKHKKQLEREAKYANLKKIRGTTDYRRVTWNV